MPVSSAGHLPHITPTSYPALVSYLTSTYHAQKVANWTISIRIFRSSYEKNRDQTSRPKSMYVVSFSEFSTETFILIEDGEKDTRASVRNRIQEQKQQQDFFMTTSNTTDNNEDPAIAAQPPPLPPSNNSVVQLQTSLQKTSTRYTLFTSSTQYSLLLSRLNLPPALGAPSMGDGMNSNHAAAGPGAWLPRGGTIIIEGATYELPSAARYGVEETATGSNCEWRVRLGMLQSGASRSAGAIIENEYLPLLRISDPMLLLSNLHGLFPTYLTNPTNSGQGQQGHQAINSGTTVHYPSPEQWDEVIPASNQGWVENLDKAQVKDQIGWKGKERGRRLAYLYITLLRAQGLL